MKRLLFIVALFLVLGVDGFASNYVDALDGLSNVGQSGTYIVSSFGRMLLTIAGWGLFIGFPFAAYKSALSYFKKQDERDDSSASSALTQAKAGGMALVGAFVGYMMFLMIFINLMHLDEAWGTKGVSATTGQVVVKILGLS